MKLVLRKLPLFTWLFIFLSSLSAYLLNPMHPINALNNVLPKSINLFIYFLLVLPSINILPGILFAIGLIVLIKYTKKIGADQFGIPKFISLSGLGYMIASFCSTPILALIFPGLLGYLTCLIGSFLLMFSFKLLIIEWKKIAISAGILGGSFYFIIFLTNLLIMAQNWTGSYSGHLVSYNFSNIEVFVLVFIWQIIVASNIKDYLLKEEIQNKK